MNQAIKNLNEALKKIEGYDKMVMTDNDLLSVLTSALEGFSESDAADTFKKFKGFQAAHDRHVQDLISKKEKEFADKLSSKDQELKSIKDSIPRPNDPAEIKKRLDAETDPAEKRILQVELSAALTAQENARMKEENEQAKKEKADQERRAELIEFARNNQYSIPDVSVFLPFGEKAVEKLQEFAQANNKIVEDRIAELSAKKFAGAAQRGGHTPPEGTMSLEDIEKLPTRAEREEQYKKLGLME